MVSLTLGGADSVAFAVYSADDGSLNFYKRMDVPEVGDTFEDKIVTKIYTGFETDVYLTDESSSYNGAVNTPWYEERESITAIDIVDSDIKPKSMAFWFQHLSKLQSITGLSKLDTSQTISFQHTFAYTQTIQSVDISGFDTSASRSFDACFTHSGITGIDLSNWNVENSASMGWIFAGCYSLETVKMPCSMTADGLQLRSTFEAATSLQSVDMSGFRPIGLRSVSDIFSGCRNLVEVKGIEGWDTSECTSFDRAFKSCALQALDISGWILPANATSENMLDNMPSIESVSVGAGFELYRCALPTQSFDGADGKWYSTTTGIGYAQADIPSRKADTYVASKELLPKVAFAVYSEDDGSLDFYKRAFCDMPTAGDAFDGKTVTSVYTGFEEDAYTGTWPNDNCPWFNITDKVKSITVVDTIRPKSMAWWFNQFYKCKSFDLRNIDTSKCVSLRRLFSSCASCISITGLDRWDTGSVVDLSATFDGLFNLKTIPGISGWDTGNVKYFAATFYNLYSLEQLDLSNWDDSSLIPGVAIDGIGYSGDIVGSSEGTMKSLKSFTVGSKWRNTRYLAKRIELASSGTIPTDGKWYAASDGSAYEPAAIPSNKADTYYASAILSAVAKDANGWTLDEQEAVAEDIAAKGDASPAYAKAKAAMDSGTTWSIALTNGETITYRIIGINHDDLADESGKAGLTFLTISHGIYSRMNATNSNAGGWEKSELRAKMNSGEIWNLMPSKFRDKVKTVTKFTNNIGGNNENCTVTATSDRLFLLSYSEIVETPYSGWSGYNWIGKEGSQYELFHNTVLENFSNNSIIAIGESWWERSTTPSYSTRFCNVNGEGDPSGNYDPTQSFCVLPAFCF